MDEYKKKLRSALEVYAKEAGCDPFRYGKDGDYSYMVDMDSLGLGLDTVLGFAISNTRQGGHGIPFLDVSYWSKAIGKQISFGEIVPNFESADAFIDWAAEIREEVDALEKQLPVLKN